MSSREQARALRKKSTWAEKLMWEWLRNRRFSAYKFRRQHPQEPYTFDFYCHQAQHHLGSLAGASTANRALVYPNKTATGVVRTKLL